MENTDTGSGRKFLLIGLLGLVLLVLVVAGALLSKKSPIKRGNPAGASPTIASVKYPKTYSGMPISDKYLTQAVSKYQNSKDAPATIYEDTVDYVKRYYMYKDALEENNVTVPKTDESNVDAVVAAVPQLHQLVMQNLISQVDFVYIKARFKLYPTTEVEAEIQKQIPNIEARARELIQKYKAKLGADIVNAQQILNESNSDPDLTQINYLDKNEFIRGYTSNQNLFFTDPDFNTFLFSQKRGTVSEVYELKQDGVPYAYLVVYPTNITVKKYQSVDDIVNEKKSNFEY